MVSSQITRLYAFGSNGGGQLGVGHTQDLSAPLPCKFSRNDASSSSEEDTLSCGLHGDAISKIVAGGNHTLILTESGRLFAAGSNEYGQCGVSNEQVSTTCFKAVQSPSERRITNIAATWSASFFVEAGRKVFVLGSGEKGELGLGEGINRSPTSRLVYTISDAVSEDLVITQIVAGMNHVVILLSDGTIFGWGACRKGQLGKENTSAKICWNTARISLPAQVQNVAVGRDYTILNDSQGRLILLGDNKHFPDLADRPVSSLTYLQSGWSSILCLKEGRLVGYGRNDRGQLPATDLELVRKFAAGSEHTIALLFDGTIVAWGWGEHGNCGTPLDARGNVVGRTNSIDAQLEPGEHVVGLAAGCATSFFWTTQEI